MFQWAFLHRSKCFWQALASLFPLDRDTRAWVLQCGALGQSASSLAPLTWRLGWTRLVAAPYPWLAPGFGWVRADHTAVGDLKPCGWNPNPGADRKPLPWVPRELVPSKETCLLVLG